MGAGIAMNFLNVGIPVTLLETSQELCEKARARVKGTYEMSSAFKKGKLTPAAVEQKMALFSTTSDYADLSEADMVIEAAFENMPLKKQIFEKLDAVCKPGAVLASNTSNLSVDELASCTKRPQDVVGMRTYLNFNHAALTIHQELIFCCLCE